MVIPVQADARELSIHGMTQPISVVVGTPREGIAARYEGLIADLLALWKPSSTTNAGNATLLYNAASSLNDLLVNGMTVPKNLNDPFGDQVRAVVNYDMALQGAQVLASLRAMGFDYTSNANATEQLNSYTRWQDFATAGNLLSAVVSPDVMTLLTNSYITTADQQIFDTINQLNTSIALNQKVLGTLTDIQNVRNTTLTAAIAPVIPTSIQTGVDTNNAPVYTLLKDPNTGQWNNSVVLTGTEGVFTISTSTSSNQARINSIVNPLIPGVNVTAGDITSILGFRSTIQGYINQLAAAQGGSFNFASGTVGATLQTIFNQLPTASSGITAWVYDGYNAQASSTSTNAGAIQRSITTAITAAENINDTQKQQIQNELFVYEEFYKSASSIMQSMHQSMTAIAQNIGS